MSQEIPVKATVQSSLKIMEELAGALWKSCSKAHMLLWQGANYHARQEARLPKIMVDQVDPTKTNIFIEVYVGR